MQRFALILSNTNCSTNISISKTTDFHSKTSVTCDLLTAASWLSPLYYSIITTSSPELTIIPIRGTSRFSLIHTHSWEKAPYFSLKSSPNKTLLNCTSSMCGPFGKEQSLSRYCGKVSELSPFFLRRGVWKFPPTPARILHTKQSVYKLWIQKLFPTICDFCILLSLLPFGPFFQGHSAQEKPGSPCKRTRIWSRFVVQKQERWEWGWAMFCTLFYFMVCWYCVFVTDNASDDEWHRLGVGSRLSKSGTSYSAQDATQPWYLLSEVDNAQGFPTV